MASLMERLKAKQKADEDRREARLEKRRGYAQAGRERERARRLAESGLSDLPLLVATAIEELPAKEPTPEPVLPDASVEELVGRLEAIKDHIFRLYSVWAVSLSRDCAIQVDQFRAIFQSLAAELQKKDPDALAKIIQGHEEILLSPTLPVKQTIPHETQRLVEDRWEVMRSPARREPKPPTVSDGLDWLVS